MKHLIKIIAGAVIALAGATSAHAGGVTVVCGNSSLGLRTTTVDPAMSGSCYAGMDNLGDPALEALINSEYGITDAEVLERDTGNSNGGTLTITGVGTNEGEWSFDASVWNTNQRVFLYFHFGDGQDDPSSTSTTDPDIYIVELVKPDNAGTWVHFDGIQDQRQQYGLSNIALIRGGEGGGGGGGGGDAPEPGSLALVGAGLLGAYATRRRQLKLQKA